jgi:hypothetical protein
MMAARWFGTVIDPDASLDLDLAQDFAWPKLGSIDDLTDNIQGRLEVSLQSKLGAATVTSFNESSPLETASDVTVELVNCSNWTQKGYCRFTLTPTKLVLGLPNLHCRLS